MDWSKGERTVTFNYKIRRVIATGSQAGRSTVGVGASRHCDVGCCWTTGLAARSGSRADRGSRIVVPARVLWAHRNTLYICAQRGSQV